LPSLAERSALRLLQIGAIAVVLVVSTYRVFELDRFFAPKELAFHATAVLAGLLALGSVARVRRARVDLLLLGYLLVSVASAALATNPWAGWRAAAISVSSVTVFLIARALRDAGLARAVVATVAFAVVLASLTALAQAYGLRLDLFSMNRAPGGTLGNRNFVGHAAAFGLPCVLYLVLRARSTVRFIVAGCGLAIVSAALVLTRSRGAWLAAVVVLAVFLLAMLFASALRRDGRTWARLLVAIVLAGAAVAAALAIPNTLRWRSDNPYLESVQGIAAFDEGSGRGRLIQYERSLIMALHHPVLGAGPGNWPVVYPAHAVRRDPSMNPSEPGTTYNPWPSSDWIAFVSERGPVATLLIGLAMLSMALAGLRRLLSATHPRDAMLATALLGTIAGAVVAGAFDAVLLLAMPALLVWMTLGALSQDGPAQGRIDPPAPETRRRPLLILLFLVLIAGSAAGAARSAGQLMAMDLYAVRGDRASLSRAATLDPGNYRVRLRLARGGKRAERCEHARALYAMYPNSVAAREAARRCR
jgi:O-antigen ligase